ncbi:phage portal protein [Gracilibacillus saliphilus]|uniref:phage portal protein n=1 Tax=Gracilibacillus saliphilus TaxID=543890 RepID=UPI0013D71612|nr:phage portal protein [Gracilibacillus saliphilus]
MLTTDYIPGVKRFSDEANIHYRFESAEKLLQDKDVLTTMIRHHQSQQQPRLQTLLNYYKGDNEAILEEKRRREEHLADNRATHNFAKYVSQFIQSYLLGVPLKTAHTDETINDEIRDININNEADEHNSDLALDQSIFGRAYELLYRSQDDQAKFVLLNPLHTFVIYDETVERKPIAAVRYISKQFTDNTTVFVYTDREEHRFTMDNGYDLKATDKKSHYFKGVPVNEYENNKFRQGDFEDVLSLIDLYDSAQSDTANYMQDLNDAMLVIKGELDLEDQYEEDPIEVAQRMKEANILYMKPPQLGDGREGNVDAGYIYKQYDVSGTEAYKDRVFSNILLFTSIPNLLDDESNRTPQSGEALKMKLFALQQKKTIKERLFKKSLRNRYRLINNILSIASEGGFNVDDITITFSENLPPMLENELKWFTDAGGKLSQETLLSQLSFVENADDEMQKIKKEDEQQPTRQRSVDMYREFAQVNQEEVKENE